MNEKFLEVGDVMQILGISRSAAYKLMRQINSELEKKESKFLYRTVTAKNTDQDDGRGNRYYGCSYAVSLVWGQKAPPYQ